MNNEESKECFECGSMIQRYHRKVFLYGKVAHASCVKSAKRRLEELEKEGYFWFCDTSAKNDLKKFQEENK